MGQQQWIDQQVDSDFSRARLSSLFHDVLGFFRQEPRALLPFEAVRSRINIRGQLDRGIQTVPLDGIIGSEGRYTDFDRMFLPRHAATRERWKNVGRAHYSDVLLPPVELYKIGEAYFVRDGNHRVSVARQQNQLYIDAHVIELVSDVLLNSSLTDADLEALEEQSDFLEWTQLHELRPDQQLLVSQPGGYLDLIRHINGHRYFKSLELGHDLTSQEAVISWYDTIYLPLVNAIENTGILDAFPDRTPTDLYLWMMDHRHYLTETEGFDPGAEEAVLDYTRHFGPRWKRHSLPPAPASEERDFLAWSQLGRLYPNLRIPLSEPQDYKRLRHHVGEHQYYLGQNLGRAVGLAEAAQSWFETLYQPINKALHQQQLLLKFPNCLPADLYLVIAEHLHVQRGLGVQIDPHDATHEYAERFGNERASLLTGALHRASRLIRRLGV